MMHWLVKNGRLTNLSSFLVVLIPAGCIFGVLYFQPNFWMGTILIALGVMVGVIGIGAGAAESVGISPFTNDPIGWRKAKKSYEQDTSPQSDDSEKR